MEEKKVPYEAIIFVCTNARGEGERVSCANPGRPGAKIRDLLKAEVAARGLKGRVRVSASGCMDLCEQGPNVMIFQEGKNVMFQGVKEEDSGKIVETLRRHPGLRRGDVGITKDK